MQFHDWVLESIEVDWAISIASIHIRGPRKRKTVTCKGFSNVVIPREESWGPSESIYSLSLHKDDALHAQILNIEMQSGDVIHIIAKEIILPIEERMGGKESNNP